MKSKYKQITREMVEAALTAQSDDLQERLTLRAIAMVQADNIMQLLNPVKS